MNAEPPTPNPLSSERKVISIIFADLMGSTALHERLDPESVNRVMDAYYQAAIADHALLRHKPSTLGARR